MLSHKNRFHGHGSLRYVFRNGQTARNRQVLVRFSPNPHRVHSRVAVIVGKKVAKSAVKRNRIRRRVFEVIRLNWDHIAPAHDITLTIFSAEFVTIPHAELERTILGALSQAKLYSKQFSTSDTLDEV